MSEIAIISTRDVKYFGVSPKVGTREVQVQTGVNEENN